MFRIKPSAAVLAVLVTAVSLLNMDMAGCAASSHKITSHTCKQLLPSPATVRPVQFSLPWDANAQGGFIMSMTGDRAGHIWVGTEDQGAWRFDRSAPAGKQWTQFNAQNGLGDNNCYALTCDRLGRVWAGTLYHGVSVFNGKDWETYGPLEGPLGSRIFALTTSPTDGDVWMSTEAGLARYSLTKNTWSYYTRAEGLPSDQAQALAFDYHGNLFVGTDCDGIAIGSAVNNFKTWRVVPGPSILPNTERGDGLPSGLINALLVTHDGVIYAGTTAGLAASDDDGETWQFQRGADWQDKLAGLYRPVAPVLRQTDPKPLLEDYITSLAEDSYGHIWIGHRTKGYEVLLGNNARAVPDAKDPTANDYLEALYPLSSGQVLLGKYGGGLGWAEAATGVGQAAFATPNISGLLHGTKIGVKAGVVAALPLPAQLPTESEINATIARLGHLPPPSSAGTQIAALDDDWVTHGTWADHYGHYAAIMCAMNGGGFDQVRSYDTADLSYNPWIGINGSAGDFLRYYVQSPRTDDPRSLQNMLYGGHKEAEWDDHGETKPTTLDGPNVYCTVKIPKGQFLLSCYEFNKDGHDGMNRLRDYEIQVRTTPMSEHAYDRIGSAKQDAITEQQFEDTPEGATARVVHFWGGVWKRFYICMPEDTYVTIQVKRNYSLNTILCGVFLDPFTVPYIDADLQESIPQNERFLQLDKTEKSLDSVAANAVHLMNVLLALRDTKPTWYAQYSRPYLLTVLRLLFRNEGYTGCLAEDVDRFMAYLSYERDLSLVFRDLQEFHQSDLVYSDQDLFFSWEWDKLNQAWAQYGYDHSKYSSVVVWSRQDIRDFHRKQQVSRLYMNLGDEAE